MKKSKTSKGLQALMWSFVIISLIIGIGTVIINNTSLEIIHGNLADAEIDKSAAPVQYEQKISYVLKEHNGKIGIFTESGKLYSIIDVAVVTLPINERQRLENGIKISSEKELYSLIEDYTG